MDPWTVGLAATAGGALVACVVLVLGVLRHVERARADARDQERRAGDAELREARAQAARAEERAAHAEAQRVVLQSVSRRYLERMRGMVGGAPLSDDDARVLLDATADATGAGPPGAPAPGDDGARRVVG